MEEENKYALYLAKVNEPTKEPDSGNTLIKLIIKIIRAYYMAIFYIGAALFNAWYFTAYIGLFLGYNIKKEEIPAFVVISMMIFLLITYLGSYVGIILNVFGFFLFTISVFNNWSMGFDSVFLYISFVISFRCVINANQKLSGLLYKKNRVFRGRI